MEKSKLIIGFIVILLLTYAAAAIGSLGTMDAVKTWYPGLNAPFFKPPNWIFGPVWSILYTAMAVAAFLVWRKGWNHRGVKMALMLYAIQLVLNSIWSLLFFKWHLMGFALVEIILLLFCIILTFINFRRIDKVAGWLFIPYIAWVSFATILNGGFWWLN